MDSKDNWIDDFLKWRDENFREDMIGKWYRKSDGHKKVGTAERFDEITLLKMFEKINPKP